MKGDVPLKRNAATGRTRSRDVRPNGRNRPHFMLQCGVYVQSPCGVTHGKSPCGKKPAGWDLALRRDRTLIGEGAIPALKKAEHAPDASGTTPRR